MLIFRRQDARGLDRDARAGSGRGERADLSERQRPADRAGAGRRRDRHHGAHRGAAAHGSMGSGGRRRQPSGRQHRGRSAGGRSIAGGRAHAAGRVGRELHRQPASVQQACLTSTKEFTPILVLCRATPVLVVIASVQATNVRRADRARQGQSRETQLRLLRRRHLCPPEHGGLQAAHRHRHRAHPVSRRGARRDRAACRRRLHAAPQSQQHRSAREDRQGAHPRRRRRELARPRGPSCRPSPRPACRASRPRSGSRCSARPTWRRSWWRKSTPTCRKVLDLPQTREFFKTNSFERVDLSPAQFAALIETQFEALGRADQGVGAKIE